MRSISAGSNLGFRPMSDSKSRAGSMFCLSTRMLADEKSVVERLPMDAPICAASSAICSALRWFVPSVSMAAVKEASPGFFSGLASLPVSTTRWAEITGSDANPLKKPGRSEEHTSELQSHSDLVCRLLLEKKKKTNKRQNISKQNHITMNTKNTEKTIQTHQDQTQL